MHKELVEVLKEEHQVIRGAPPVGAVQSLEEIHKIRNRAGYSAICLSGGGIRSATFNLGVLQALAQARLLDQFDYLSTVSGGGFIGSWFSAWKYRDRVGAADLKEPLAELSRVEPMNSNEPEPQTVQHLRAYSNYLSPQVGLLSADFWTLIAIYLRNLVLTNLVFVPFILAVLLLPRLMYAWISLAPGDLPAPNLTLFLLFALGTVMAFRGILFIAMNLPRNGRNNGDEKAYISSCLLPLIYSTISFVTIWGWYVRGDWQTASMRLYVFELIRDHTLGVFVALALLLLLGPLFAAFRTSAFRACVLVAAVAVLTALVVFAIVTRADIVSDTRWYVTGTFPLLFGLIMLGGTLVAGATSHFTSDQDEEWWARAGGWMMIVAVGWIVVCALVLWVPQFVLSFLGDVVQHPRDVLSGKSNIAATIAGFTGALATIVSLVSGFSSMTPAGDDRESGLKTFVLAHGTGVLSTLALIFIFATLAALTNPILAFLSWHVPMLQPIQAAWSDHPGVLRESSLTLVALSMLTLGAAVFVFGRCIDTNKFSLHYFWRNRIVRAYAGASRDRSKVTVKTAVAFTGFDPADNIKMSLLKDQRPFHIVNAAINLVGSKRLDWQERMAESFTITGLHCGNYWLGYRDSGEYGRGISLGTAVAISGAAASPNMGYMMSSPVVRMLMTLFNVRLGTWLGNPGPPGEHTYKDHAPVNIIRPIIAEALGQTDDESPYVYLSDGGHFENLGLYEVVLRRARFIVVSDASTDPKYTYESLGQAIRKIRVDFGIPIEFRAFPNIGRFRDGSGAYCALAKIGYSHVDKGCKDGWLIYLKPSLNQNEPRDVMNYLEESPDFPQEPIADQFFTESQFESYRALGFLIVNRIIRGATESNIQSVFEHLFGVIC